MESVWQWADVVTVRSVGNQKHYQANAEAPIFEELKGIVRKTFGLAEPLRQALGPLAKRLVAVFVYGSVAKNTDTAASDIDLMVISDELTYLDLFGALEAASAAIGRTVNPTILTRKELAKRVKAKESFTTRVLAQPKIWIVGDGSADNVGTEECETTGNAGAFHMGGLWTLPHSARPHETPAR